MARENVTEQNETLENETVKNKIENEAEVSEQSEIVSADSYEEMVEDKNETVTEEIAPKKSNIKKYPRRLVIRDRILTEIYLLLMSAGAVVGMQMLNGWSVKSCEHYYACNVLVVYLVYKVFYLLINHLAISVGVAGFVLYLFSIANHYVYQFRGVMIVPWDFLSLGTAADVAGTYSLTFYKEEAVWFVIWLLSILGASFIYKGGYFGKRRTSYVGISLIVCLISVQIMTSSEVYKSIPDRLYLIERYYKNQGIAVSFFNYAKFLIVETPEGYNKKSAFNISHEYLTNSSSRPEDIIEPTNVIVIMNESFTDFSSIGSIPEIEECTKNIHGLSENTVKGNLIVPVFGGTTVNSEYEFLTGNSIAFKKGCPFSYAIRSNRPSVVRIFAQKGYATQGFHPANANNWNRKSVYPFLGFENSEFLDSLDENSLTLVNQHATDICDYDELIRLYENRTADKFFAFNVTMQNHSGYGFDFKADTGRDKVDLSKYGDMPEAENYLSLLKMSDEAIGYLIDYFSKVNEPTLICFFGDHQPKVEEEFVTLLNNGQPLEESDAKSNIKKYATPFFIWANYDIEEQNIEYMSANYLSGLMLECGNFELPPYYRLLRDMRESYPVFSVNGVIDNEGNFYNTDELKDDPLITKYRYMTFNSSSDQDKNIYWDAYGAKP